MSVHPYDRHLQRHELLRDRQRDWTPADGPLPAVFLGHGAPPLFEDTPWMEQFHDWALALPKPKDILVVSAHWEAAPMAITSPAAATPLVYDFGGFDRRYFEMTHATPDASALARRIAATMPAGQPLHQSKHRGLDHGAWVPLKVMYPDADIPTLQLSIPSDDPEHLVELGRRLRPLRDEGTLIIGSGFLTHGLAYLRRSDWEGGPPQSWSADFDAWAADALSRGDIDTLSDFRRAPGMPYAHPTPEHYLPLFVTLGAATDPTAPVRTVIDGFAIGLAKRSFEAV